MDHGARCSLGTREAKNEIAGETETKSNGEEQKSETATVPRQATLPLHTPPATHTTACADETDDYFKLPFATLLV